MQISFIIPHKGRFEMLQETIQSISQLSYDLSKLEIIVVSQTPEIQQQTLITDANFPVQICIRPDSDSISALRNYGVKQAQGEYIAFLDADIALAKNWATQIIQLLNEDLQRIILSGTQTCHDDSPIVEKIRTSLSNAAVDTNVDFLPGCNLFLRKESFDMIGGFPEHLLTCEDYYFTDQATKYGKLYRSSAATFIHLGEDKSYQAMFKKEMWRGQSNLQSLSGRSIPLSEWPSLITPLAIAAMCLLSLILVVLGQFQYAAVAFLVAVFPIFIYSWRLFLLAQKEIHFVPIFKFYTFYFPARAIGTVLGLFKSIGIKTY